MNPPRLLRLVWLLILGAAAPSAAWGGTPTKVFPLAAAEALPSSLEGTPERLTKVIARMVGGEISDSSIKGAALAAGCTIDDSRCLDQIARANRAKEIVFGTIRVGDDLRVFVKLTRFIAGTERRERTFVLTGETPQALARQLARSARDMFEIEGEPARLEEDPAVPEREAGPPVAATENGRGGGGPADTSGGVRRGRVSRGTYLLLAGGVMTMAAGTGFSISGYILRGDLANAKRNTPNDTRRIGAIDRAQRIRTAIGAVLLAGGGLAVAGGIVRAVVQRRPIDTDRSISIVPIEGGAALVLSGRLP